MLFHSELDTPVVVFSGFPSVPSPSHPDTGASSCVTCLTQTSSPASIWRRFRVGAQVLEIWATYYGAEAGVMGLRCIPTGGLFLAGGMTHKLIHHIQVALLL